MGTRQCEGLYFHIYLRFDERYVIFLEEPPETIAVVESVQEIDFEIDKRLKRE